MPKGNKDKIPYQKKVFSFFSFEGLKNQKKNLLFLLERLYGSFFRWQNKIFVCIKNIFIFLGAWTEKIYIRNSITCSLWLIWFFWVTWLISGRKKIIYWGYEMLWSMKIQKWISDLFAFWSIWNNLLCLAGTA